MLQPNDLRSNFPVKLSNGVMSTTSQLWEMLQASYRGDFDKVKQLARECPELVYAQYNYMPPIHLAVREGHSKLVAYFLDEGAHDPAYKSYPFRESLQTIARDRGLNEIAELLEEYSDDSSRHKFKGDNGQIMYDRTLLQREFEAAVVNEDLDRTDEILSEHPDFATDETYFWGEGILTFAVKKNNQPMVDLLVSYEAKVPSILKWTQAYYFEHDEGARYIMAQGMDPDTMSWHHVTILHDMAQKGNLSKAKLLLEYGANIDLIDEEYQSTPLGMASKWGHTEMVNFLLQRGADPDNAGAKWATPLAWARKKKNNEIEKALLDAGALK